MTVLPLNESPRRDFSTGGSADPIHGRSAGARSGYSTLIKNTIGMMMAMLDTALARCAIAASRGRRCRTSHMHPTRA